MFSGQCPAWKRCAFNVRGHLSILPFLWFRDVIMNLNGTYMSSQQPGIFQDPLISSVWTLHPCRQTSDWLQTNMDCLDIFTLWCHVSSTWNDLTCKISWTIVLLMTEAILKVLCSCQTKYVLVIHFAKFGLWMQDRPLNYILFPRFVA